MNKIEYLKSIVILLGDGKAMRIMTQPCAVGANEVGE